MAVKIRLKRMGKIRAPFYRIVVADSRVKRDGRTIEQIGKYHPKVDPSIIEVDSERVQHWLSVGAQPSEPVLRLLKVTGDWQKFKGEPAPAEGVKVAPDKAPKRTMFDEALRDAHAEPKTEAVSQKKTRKKAEEKPAAEEAPVAAAAEEPAAEAPAESES